MESREIHCQKCNKDTQHTFRYHITKTKHYSVVSVGSGKKEITLVCHVCLLETSVDKNDSKELVIQYDNEIETGEANELMDKGKDSKAENKLRKVLKKDPEFPQALYSISKCLISQAKYGEAEFYIKILENKFPDIPEIKELRDSLPPKLGAVDPKPAVISSEVNSSGEELEESKRRLEEAERELEEKKLEKEESRKNKDIEKQIAINEEKIRKIEEESKKLDEDEGRII